MGEPGTCPTHSFLPERPLLPGQPSFLWQSVDHLPLSQGLISGYPSCPRLAVALGTPLSMKTRVPAALRTSAPSRPRTQSILAVGVIRKLSIHSVSIYWVLTVWQGLGQPLGIQL